MAAVSINVDRTEMYSDEQLQLTIRVSPKGQINQQDLTSLQSLFHIVQQRQFTSSQTVNGRSTTETSYQLLLQPKQIGILTIPAFRSGNDISEPLPISVLSSRARKDGLSDDAVVLSASLSKSDPYLNEPFQLTIEIAYKIQLTGAVIRELELADFDVAERNEYQDIKTINGQQYKVYQQVVTLTPTAAGLFTMPEVTFVGDYLDSSTRQTKRFTRTASIPPIAVKAVPEDYPQGAYWLPVRSLTIQDDLDTSRKFTEGDYIDWLVLMTVNGIEASRLPDPLQSLETQLGEELRLYRNAPEMDATRRVDQSALTFSEAGTVTLPAIRVPWWNLTEDRLEWAELPERTLEVAAAAQPAVIETAPAPIIEPQTIAEPLASTQVVRPGYWPYLAAFFFLAWLGTTAFFLYRSKNGKIRRSTETSTETSPDASIQTLKKLAKIPNHKDFYDLMLKYLNEKGHSISVLKGALPNESADCLSSLESSLFNNAAAAPDKKQVIGLVKDIQQLTARRGKTSDKEGYAGIF